VEAYCDKCYKKVKKEYPTMFQKENINEMSSIWM
jgi:hypothetical protein